MNTEAELQAALQAAIAMEAIAEALDVMTHIAAQYIVQGYTQEGADVLAYVLLQPETPVDTYETALELFEDLETRICPRVILDAREFARLANLTDLKDYILAPHDI